MNDETIDDFRKEYLDAAEVLQRLNSELRDAIGSSRLISEASESLSSVSDSFRKEVSAISAALAIAPAALESLNTAVSAAELAMKSVTPSEVMQKLMDIEASLSKDVALKSKEMDELRKQVKSLTEDLARKSDQLASKTRQLDKLLTVLKIIPEKMRRKWNIPTESDL